MEGYTLEQVKAAFWSKFHEIGEVWFAYGHDPADSEKSTQAHWHEFVEALKVVD